MPTEFTTNFSLPAPLRRDVGKAGITSDAVVKVDIIFQGFNERVSLLEAGGTFILADTFIFTRVDNPAQILFVGGEVANTWFNGQWWHTPFWGGKWFGEAMPSEPANTWFNDNWWTDPFFGNLWFG